MEQNLIQPTVLISDDEGIVESKINNDIVQDLEPNQRLVSKLTSKPRAKRVVSEKTKEALRLGREKLAEKWKNDKVKNEELKEKYVVKKANKIIKQKLKIKEQIGAEELDSEEEEPIKLIQQKKPRKKQIIVLPPESDSEEEIVLKKESKKKIKESPEPSFDNNNAKPKILFY
jgi:hypothetical protein